MEEETDEMVDKCINSDQADCLEQQLYSAVFFQDFVKFEKLLSHLPGDFDVDFVIDCDREENSLVLLSCAKPVKFIQLLTERGANLFITTPNKKNALHIACEYGRLDVVQFLVENVNDRLNFLVESLEGRTVLHYALRAEQNREEIINYLQSKLELNINQVLSSGSTVLLDTVLAGDIETAEILCRHGADPNIGMSGTYKAIHIASQQPGNAKIIQLLLDHGANKDEIWRHGQRPIHLAMKHRLNDNVSILLNSGAKYCGKIKLQNRQFRNISTVCLMAWKCPNLVPELLNRGANPSDIHPPSGSSVLGLVLENNGSSELIKSIILHGANPTGSHRGKPLVKYCQNIEQILVFLEHGISLETIEKEIGQSLLRLALSENGAKNQETTEKELQNLLSHGAKLHFTSQKVDSELILAIRRGYFRIADFLLEFGADIMHVGRNGNTIIHIICEHYHQWSNLERDIYCRKLLHNAKEAGADFNVKNENGMTPLLCHLFSSTQPDESIFELLTLSGADIYTLHPISSKSILAHAISNCQKEIIDAILKAKYDVNKPESNGEPPILSCLPIDSANKKYAFKKLLERGASANVRDSNGMSLIEHVLDLVPITTHLKSQYFFNTNFQTVVSEIKDLLNSLMCHGADINTFGKEGNTPLFIAIHKGLFSVAKHLIENEADVNRVGASNLTTFECCFEKYLRILDEFGEEEACLSTLSSLISAGFHMDVCLSNGLFPFEMVCKHKNMDKLLKFMIRRAKDLDSLSQKKQLLLYSLLDKHPSVIREFIRTNTNVKKMTTDGRSAFEVYSEGLFFDLVFEVVDAREFLNVIDHHFLDSFLYASMLAMWKSDATLRIFREPYRAILHSSPSLKQKREAFAMLPKCKREVHEFDAYESQDEKEEEEGEEDENGDYQEYYTVNRRNEFLEFDDEKTMLEALDLNDTAFQNRKEYLSYLQNDRNELTHQCCIDAIEECCNAIKDLIEYENISVNNKLSWGIYPICVAVKLRSPSLVQFMLEKGADPNVMETWEETPLSLSIILQQKEVIDLLVAAKANVNHMGATTSKHDSPKQSLLGRSLKRFQHSQKSKDSKYRLPEFSTCMLDIVKLLLDNGANVNRDIENVDSALIEAVRMQDLDIVNLLLEHGANSNHKGMEGLTALHVLFLQKLQNSCTCQSMIDVLMEHGACINLKSESGETPLHVALQRKLFRVIPKLITLELDPNVRDNQGLSYLMLAAKGGAVDVCQLLVDIGADCFFLDKKGNSALHYACHQNFNCGIFDFFLKRGCDINLQNIEGYTPLFEYLSKNDNVDNFDLLLESGADPNLSQEKCDSPLMIAIERHWNNERLTTSLLNRVNVNHRGPSDTTALHVALAQVTGHKQSRSMSRTSEMNKMLDENNQETTREKLVNQLLQKGAVVNALTSDGLSPLEVLLSTKLQDDSARLLSRLLECKSDPNLGDNPPICHAADTLNITLIKMLLEAGADINTPNKEGKPPLICCLPEIDCTNEKHGKILKHVINLEIDESVIFPVVEFLVNNGALVHSKSGENSPLHMAVSANLSKTTEFLIEKGACVNHIGSNQRTPLLMYMFPRHSCQPFGLGRIYEQKTSALELLLLHKANPNTEDHERNAPLNCAYSRNADISDMQCLLKAGADPLHKGKDGYNAYEQALQKDWPYLKILIKECGLDHITKEISSMFLKKVLEWEGEDNLFYSKETSSYKSFIEVSINILGRKDDVDVNIVDERGNTPLIIYSRFNECSVIKCLIEKGADVHHVNKKGHNALYALFLGPDRCSKRDTVHLLVKHGCDFKTEDKTGDNLFEELKKQYISRSSLLYHDGIEHSSRDFLLSILESINSSNHLGNLETLLLGAAKTGDFLLLDRLIQKGADCRARDILGLGVMHLCMTTHRGNNNLRECLDCIITYKNYGGSLTEVDDKKNTLIALFLSSSLIKPVLNEEESVFNAIIDILALNKGIVNTKNNIGLTPLMKAAASGSYAGIKRLWARGAKVNAKDNEGNSPLHAAFSKDPATHCNILKIVNFFLDKGVDINSKNRLDETPLYLALDRIINRDIRLGIVKLLLSKGANPNFKGKKTIPLIKAVAIRDVTSVIQLLQLGAKTEIHQEKQKISAFKEIITECCGYSCSRADIEDISKLIILLNERKNNINKTTNEGKSLLHLTSIYFWYNQHIAELIKVLIDLGADVNAKDKEGNSPLFAVSKTCSGYTLVAVGELLLRNGANPNDGPILFNVMEKMSNEYQNESLKEFIYALIDSGADTNRHEKETPNLILAVGNMDIDLVKLMLENGANINAQDSDGNTCLHSALSLHYENAEKRKDMIEMLLSYRICLSTKCKYRENALSVEIRKLTDRYEAKRPVDGLIVIDLSVFNMLICGGSDFEDSDHPERMGTSQLVMLINAGMCKAAATLIKCGGCIGKEQELGKLDLSEYDWSSYDGYMSYERINYENDVRHLKTVVADAIAKSEEIPSLAFMCRETIRKHLLCCAGGAEIESMISFLQIPQTLKSFLSLRDYTFEHEIIEVIERPVTYFNPADYFPSDESTDDNSSEYDDYYYDDVSP